VQAKNIYLFKKSSQMMFFYTLMAFDDELHIEYNPVGMKQGPNR